MYLPVHGDVHAVETPEDLPVHGDAHVVDTHEDLPVHGDVHVVETAEEDLHPRDVSRQVGHDERVVVPKGALELRHHVVEVRVVAEPLSAEEIICYVK